MIFFIYDSIYYYASKLNALKLDERLYIEDLEEKIWKLEKSIELLNDQLDRIYFQQDL